MVELLYKELGYKIQGAAIEVRKIYGPGQKEKVYQNAFSEELGLHNVPYEKEKSIIIFSPKTDNAMGVYRPDFIVDNKIIVELKALTFVPRDQVLRMYDYLRNSKFELGYFINFSSVKLYIKRIILTNDRKYPQLKID